MIIIYIKSRLVIRYIKYKVKKLYYTRIKININWLDNFLFIFFFNIL